MKLIILGSGASVAFPRPCCQCSKCVKARKKGIPYARTGPSLFVLDERILFDTPEEIVFQLNREKIKQVNAIFYTHWHPDHMQGLRVFEHIKYDYDRKRIKPIPVFVPKDCLKDFEGFYANHFKFFEEQGYAEMHETSDRKPVKIGEITVTPLNLMRPDRVRYAYLIEDSKGCRAVYAPCSVFGMKLDEYYSNLDLLVLELGWHGKTLETRKKLPKTHAWQDHISFEEDIEIIRKIKPRQTILTQLEGTRHETWESANKLMKPFYELNIKIAFDGMRVEL